MPHAIEGWIYPNIIIKKKHILNLIGYLMIIISFWCIYPVSFLTNPVYNSKLDKFAGPRSQWTASMENQHNTSIFRIKHEVFRIKNLHPKLGKRGL